VGTLSLDAGGARTEIFGSLGFSTPIVERAGLTWGVGEQRIPALGSVSVAVILAGDVFYIPRVLVCAGMHGGVWSPSWAATRGIVTHINFGPDSPASWLVTPSDRRVPLVGPTLVFAAAFARHRVPEMLRRDDGGDAGAHAQAYRGGVQFDGAAGPSSSTHTAVVGVGPVATDAVVRGCLGACGGNAADSGFVTFIVDSGADLHIAGAFIYPYADVVRRDPGISVKGIDGELTRVNAVVRTTVVFGDGRHLVSEILVCDAFQVALWSVPFATHFGFAAMLGAQGQPSVVQTPTGYEQPLLLNPYRMRLLCLNAARRRLILRHACPAQALGARRAVPT
jgi:hypothetical protein